MITLKAYAKINLGLRVLRKREDGYYDIETVFYRANPYDEITFEPSSTITLMHNDPELPTDDNNLCVRAAKILQQYTGIKKGVNISLKKKIPIGAGLGGGSSDAAATLLGLVKLWNLKIHDDDLHTLALRLGSDVPYFLKRGTAYATGRGEILEYFDPDVPYWIVLVYPNIQVSTAWAYQAIRESKHDHISNPTPQITLKKFLIDNIHNPTQLTKFLHNDFESVVFRAHESISDIKQSLYNAGAKFAQMSGSGSAVFGFFSNEHDAKKVAEKLQHQYKVFTTPPHFKHD